MFKKINATVLIVKDLGKSRAFYGDTLGLKVLFEDDVSTGYQMADHDFLVLQETAAAQMMSEEAVGIGQAGAHRVLLCTEVENVDETYRTLLDKGINCLKEPRSQAWGRRTAYFADPEGNLWEIYHHLPESE